MYRIFSKFFFFKKIRWQQFEWDNARLIFFLKSFTTFSYICTGVKEVYSLYRCVVLTYFFMPKYKNHGFLLLIYTYAYIDFLHIVTTIWIILWCVLRLTLYYILCYYNRISWWEYICNITVDLFLGIKYTNNHTHIYIRHDDNKITEIEGKFRKSHIIDISIIMTV